MTDFFRSAQDQLIFRIGHENVGDWDGGALTDFLYSQGIFGTALCHAVHEMLWTGVEAGVGEETLTASLMGHLATNISWYAMMDHWAQSNGHKPRQSCDVYWAEQARATERFRGGDFGIARRIDAERFRIAFFQAKSIPLNGRIHIHRDVGQENRTSADASLRRKFRPGSAASKTITNLHQIEKIINWSNIGISIVRQRDSTDKSNKSWCRYVFWPSRTPGAHGTARPVEMTLPEIMRQLRRAIEPRSIKPIMPKDFRIELGRGDFLMGLCQEHGNDIIVNAADARRLLDKLVALKTPLPFMMEVDETGSGDGGLLKEILPPAYHSRLVAGTNMITGRFGLPEEARSVLDARPAISKP